MNNIEKLYDEYLGIFIAYHDGYDFDKFSSIIKAFDRFDLSKLNFTESIEWELELQREILSYLASDFDCTFGEIDYIDKIIYIDEWCDTSEKLKEFKELFKDWTIANYDEIITDIRDYDDKEHQSKLDKAIEIVNRLNDTQLSELIKTYGANY